MKGREQKARPVTVAKEGAECGGQGKTPHSGRPWVLAKNLNRVLFMGLTAPTNPFLVHADIVNKSALSPRKPCGPSHSWPQHLYQSSIRQNNLHLCKGNRKSKAGSGLTTQYLTWVPLEIRGTWQVAVVKIQALKAQKMSVLSTSHVGCHCGSSLQEVTRR